MSNALLFARMLSTKVSYVPGSAAVLETLRRWGGQHQGTIVINDFDGDLKFELSLDGEEDSRVFWYGALAQPVLALLHRLVHSGATVVDMGAGAERSPCSPPSGSVSKGGSSCWKTGRRGRIGWPAIWR